MKYQGKFVEASETTVLMHFAKLQPPVIITRAASICIFKRGGGITLCPRKLAKMTETAMAAFFHAGIIASRLAGECV